MLNCGLRPAALHCRERKAHLQQCAVHVIFAVSRLIGHNCLHRPASRVQPAVMGGKSFGHGDGIPVLIVSTFPVWDDFARCTMQTIVTETIMIYFCLHTVRELASCLQRQQVDFIWECTVSQSKDYVRKSKSKSVSGSLLLVGHRTVDRADGLLSYILQANLFEQIRVIQTLS